MKALQDRKIQAIYIAGIVVIIKFKIVPPFHHTQRINLASVAALVSIKMVSHLSANAGAPSARPATRLSEQ